MVASHQYVEHVLTALDLAAEANRQTPGRQGNVVVLTADLAADVMLTGDLHGQRKNFNRLRGRAALDRHSRRHLVFQEVCHGGPMYPGSAGCMSHALLEDVAMLKAKYPERVHFLLGNHELAELTDYPIQKNQQMLNVQFRAGLEHMYGPAAARVHEAYRRFLDTCPLAVRLPQGVFVSHSLPENVAAGEFDPSIFARELTREDYAERGSVFQLVWGRDYRGENARAFAQLVGAKILINGHEPSYEGFIAPNEFQLILDSCGRRAACLILPVGAELSHEEIMERVERLSENEEG
jgi:hypothetical protein